MLCTKYIIVFSIENNFPIVLSGALAVRPTERGVMSLGDPQTKRGKKTRVYLEQGKQNKMCAFVNI
jgi:hypothetical protein